MIIDDNKPPIGGVDYPRTLEEFDIWFSTEEACLEFIRNLRWPGGFQCPACGGEQGWATKRGNIRCAQCQRQTSAIAGTLFDGTRKPLRSWLEAMWHVMASDRRYGFSAMALQDRLKLGSYQTAWAWLQKLRRAMVLPEMGRLHGQVAIGVTYVEEREKGHRARKRDTKILVVVAVEKATRGPGRVRFSCIPVATEESLLQFVRAVIEPGSRIHSDGSPEFKALAGAGYLHEPNISDNNARITWIDRVVSALEVRLQHSHSGALTQEQLGYYFAEFAFRSEWRAARSPGLLFLRLTQSALYTAPTPYRGLVRTGRERQDL